MRNLLVLMTMFLMVAHANAVTPTKSSTQTAAQKRDAELAKQLAAEVEAEEQTAPANSTAITATPSSEAVIPEPTSEQIIENEMSQAEAQQEAQQSVAHVESKKQNKKNMYIMGSIGTIAYPDVGNITGRYSAMMSLGYVFDSSIIIEGGAGISQFNMDALSPTILNRHDYYDIDQYSAFLAAKYKMNFGKLAPNAGVLVAMTNRQFTQRDPNHVGNNSITADRGSSQTTDGGLTAGVDYELSQDYAIGLDMKYLVNLSNSVSGNSSNNINATNLTGYTVTPIEKLQNFSVGVSARMNF